MTTKCILVTEFRIKVKLGDRCKNVYCFASLLYTRNAANKYDTLLPVKRPLSPLVAESSFATTTTTMKVYQCATSMALPLLCFLAAEHMSTAEAARESMAVEAGGITFSIDRYDDGRSKPYRVTFTEDGVKSTYRFNTAGFVTNIVVGSEKYGVRYESNGDLSEVRRTPDGKRDLLVGAEGQNEEAGDGLLVGGDGQGVRLVDDSHRRLYACDDCVEAWDAVCDDGVPSLCDLVDYGHPITSAAKASISTMCNVMGGGACSSSGGGEACSGQCEGDDDGTDDKGEIRTLSHLT